MTGADVTAERIDERTFVLAAGCRRAVIHTSAGRFGSHDVVWEIGNEGDRAWVDGVCYQGARQAFDLSEVGEMVVAGGLELLSVDQSPSKAGVAFEHPEDGTLAVMWLVGNGLHVTAPTRAEPY